MIARDRRAVKGVSGHSKRQALDNFAWIIAVIGGLVVLAELCIGLTGLANSNSTMGGSFAAAGGASLIVTAVISAIGFGLAFLATMAAAELIMLFIAVEENTRMAARPVAAPMYAAPAPASVPMPPPYNPGYPPTYPPVMPGTTYQPPQG